MEDKMESVKKKDFLLALPYLIKNILKATQKYSLNNVNIFKCLLCTRMFSILDGICIKHFIQILGTRYDSECRTSQILGESQSTYILYHKILSGDAELYPIIKHINVPAMKIMAIHLGIMKFINGPGSNKPRLVSK